MNSIEDEFREHFEYNLEFAYDEASHLKHLQSILEKFYLKYLLKRLDLIWFFEKKL